MQAIKQLAVIGLAVISVSAFASSVTIPNTFTNGTPAVAAQVNGNFTAVKTAVDDNDARLTALEPSVAPIVVNCTSDPNGLQTALGSSRTGKLLINFSGTCNPVFIARSNVEIVGASRATAFIAGGTGATASLTIRNANYVKLKSLTVQRSNVDYMVAESWHASVVLDDVQVSNSAAGAEEQALFIRSSVDITGSDFEQISFFAGSAAVFRDNNTVQNTDSNTAMGVGSASSVHVLGNNNTFSSGGDVFDVSERSSLSFDQGTGNAITSGNIYITSSSVNLSNVLAIDAGSVSVNQGGDMVWEGADGGPNATPSFTQVSVQDNGVLHLEDVDMDVSGNFNVDAGSTLRGRRSTITAPAIYVFAGAAVSLDGVGSAVALTANVNLYDNAVLNLNYVNVTGHIGASRGGRITTQNVTISNGIDLQMFSTFFGQTTTINGGVNLAEGGIAFRGDNTTINGGGTLGAGSSFRLHGAGSNLSGVVTLNNTLNPDAWIGNGATHVGVTFNNCAGGNVAFDGYIYGVCGNDDGDGFINYQDNCPAVPGPTNGCP